MLFSNIITSYLKKGFYLYEKYFLKFQFGMTSAIDISVCDGSKDFRELYGKIDRLLNYKLEKKIIKQLIMCLKLITEGNDKSYKQRYQLVLNEFEVMEWRTFSVQRWKTLEEFFLNNGLLSLALTCRKKRQEAILDKRFHVGGAWQKAVICLEMGKWTIAKNEIKRLGEKKIYLCYLKQDIEMLKYYYNLVSGDEYFQYDIKSAQPIKDNYSIKIYGELLYKKDVVIVGPAPGESMLSLPGTHPVVVRANDRGSIDSDFEKKVLPTDIVYYNGESIEWLKRGNNAAILKEYKFIVKKNNSDDLVSDVKMRETPSMGCILSAGSMNMLPIMILDLNMVELNSLYVCRNNLYLSDSPYRTSYWTGEKGHSKFRWWHIFTVHNIFSQYILLQNLYKAGRFIPDEELKAVLDLGIEMYTAQMEDRYSFESRSI